MEAGAVLDSGRQSVKVGCHGITVIHYDAIKLLDLSEAKEGGYGGSGEKIFLLNS
jgi:hypothetical protein